MKASAARTSRSNPSSRASVASLIRVIATSDVLPYRARADLQADPIMRSSQTNAIVCKRTLRGRLTISTGVHAAAPLARKFTSRITRIRVVQHFVRFIQPEWLPHFRKQRIESVIGAADEGEELIRDRGDRAMLRKQK